MKVKGPGAGKETAKTGKAAKKGGDSADMQAGAFGALVSTHGAQDSAGASGAGAASSIAHIDMLLMAQEAEDPTQGQTRQRMKKRSHKILDALEAVRLKMLSGQLTVGDMINMADVVATHREKIDDPTLTALMDEVDLRAQVELAKLRVALDSKEAAQAGS